MIILVIILAINYQNAKVIKEKIKHSFEKRLNDSRIRENVNI